MYKNRLGFLYIFFFKKVVDKLKILWYYVFVNETKHYEGRQEKWVL